MSKANDKKSNLLGMPIGTATHRLRKTILFSLICRLKENFCYRCEKEIISENDLSIEHKEPWMQADNPTISFFSLDNISFSHLSCNISARTIPQKMYNSEADRQRARYKRRWAKMTIEERQTHRRKRYEKYGE